MFTPPDRPEAQMAALRGWVRAALILLVALAGLALLMFGPELDANPLAFIAPG